MRYEMEKDVEESADFSKGYNQFELNSSAVTAAMSHEEEVRCKIRNIHLNTDGRRTNCSSPLRKSLRTSMVCMVEK